MIRHIFAEALSALSYYRLRSALTMLSIIWGVASLMLLLSYGQGFERALTQAFLQIGKELHVFQHRQRARQGKLLATSFHPELTPDTRFHEYFVSLAK